MNIVALVAALLAFTSGTYGLDCYLCDTSGFDGEAGTSSCYATTDTGPSPTATDNCTTDTADVKYYCISEFTLEDGMTTRVRRRCIGTDADEDETSSSVIPTQDKCVTTLTPGSNPTDSTVCYFHCSAADKCNSETTSTLKTCSSNCTNPSQGHCNYLTGACVCNSGWEGAECQTSSTAATVTPRKCVQCNSETDSGCATDTATSDCPGGQMYCSSARTSIYDESDAVIRTIITRGCTESFEALDECEFTNIFSDNGINSTGYNEFTCYSTCDTDGCNTNTPNGLVDGTEAVNLQCVVCEDNDETVDGCARKTTREACPSSSTHCKATATYMISNKVDLSYSEAAPAYKLVKVKRECADAAATTECTESSVGDLSFKKVVCTETCQEDGCNIGWPARPTCLTCSSSTSDLADGYDACLENPDAAAMCTYPYQSYCFIQDTGIEENKLMPVQGYTRRITRGCSHYDLGTGCSRVTPRSTVIDSCNYTCTTDGCNVGSGAGTPYQTFVAVALPAIFGWFAQLYL